MTREEFNVLALEHLEEITAFAGRLAGNAADADDLSGWRGSPHASWRRSSRDTRFEENDTWKKKPGE